MAHWLEEAEREELRKKQRPAHESARIEDKKFRIARNYEANGAAYDAFIDRLFDLCERANSLPLEKRMPWKRIDFLDKESRLDNKLYSISTSDSFNKTVAIKKFPFFRNQHYKHLHKLYVSVSKEMGKAEFEVKDDYLAKTRLATDDKQEEGPLFDDGLPRMKAVFLYDINSLDKELAYQILDWLAFRIDTKALPFREEDLKYPQKR